MPRVRSGKSTSWADYPVPAGTPGVDKDDERSAGGEDTEPLAELLEPAGIELFEAVPGARFDPARWRERLRGRLAVASFALFGVLVLMISLAVVCGWRPWTGLQGLTTAMLPAVVGVVGTTTGFYFGSQGESGSRR